MIDIASVLTSIEAMGFFDFVLPFLLVFALVFGIMTASKMFGDNRGLHAIIAIIVGLMALRFGFVQPFFGEMFPRLAVGLSILLAGLILVGAFIPKEQSKYFAYAFVTVAALILIIITYQTFNAIGWIGGFGASTDEMIAYVISAALLIGIIIAVVLPKSSSSTGTATVPAWSH
jgi:hypothetical protein